MTALLGTAWHAARCRRAVAARGGAVLACRPVAGAAMAGIRSTAAAAADLVGTPVARLPKAITGEAAPPT